MTQHYVCPEKSCALVVSDMHLPHLMLTTSLFAAGADKAKRDLKVLRGRSEVLNLLKSKGLVDVVNLLSSLLPPLVAPGFRF